jgi:AraC-like DNA-binding protein
MLITLDELKNRDFFLSRINIFYQKPIYRELQPQSRKYNSFLYILQGKCHYYHADGDFSLAAGSLVYLPYGSNHRLVIESEDIAFYRIDFRLEVDGEIALFSNHPMKLCHTAPAECAEAIRTMAESYQFLHDSVGKNALLCTIFRSLSTVNHSPRREKLAPAVNFLMEHLTEKVRCTQLAELCCLSEAQFYNLFHAEYGMAPLEYRNSLLAKRATLLLKDGSFTVTEIADILGFESVSYFSRFFKKHTGKSPKQYMMR